MAQGSLGSFTFSSSFDVLGDTTEVACSKNDLSLFGSRACAQDCQRRSQRFIRNTCEIIDARYEYERGAWRRAVSLCHTVDHHALAPGLEAGGDAHVALWHLEVIGEELDQRRIRLAFHRRRGEP